MTSVNEQVTAIIKTYERPDHLRKLITSIRQYYPDLPVVIVDDSREKLGHDFDDNVLYIHTEHDVGLSKGRNLGVKNVYTPYTLLLDDDYLFTQETRIEDMVQIIEEQNMDIVSGDVYDFGKTLRVCNGVFELRDNKLFLVQGKARENAQNDYPLYDYLINFFLARTQILKNSPWDSELKIREHEHFFWKMRKLDARLTHTHSILIHHFPTSETAKENFYNDQRVKRMKHYHYLACSKIGVKDIKVDYTNLLGKSSYVASAGNKITSYLFLHKDDSRILGALWRFLLLVRPPLKALLMKIALRRNK